MYIPEIEYPRQRVRWGLIFSSLAFNQALGLIVYLVANV